MRKIATNALVVVSALAWLLAIANVVYAISQTAVVPAGEALVVECADPPDGFGVHAVGVQVDSNKVRVDCALAPVPVPTYTPVPTPAPVPIAPRRIGPPERNYE